VAHAEEVGRARHATGLAQRQHAPGALLDLTLGVSMQTARDLHEVAITAEHERRPPRAGRR
jgi:hypothetical protein